MKFRLLISLVINILFLSACGGSKNDSNSSADSATETLSFSVTLEAIQVEKISNNEINEMTVNGISQSNKMIKNN